MEKLNSNPNESTLFKIMLRLFANQRNRGALVFTMMVISLYSPSLPAQIDTLLPNTLPKVVCYGVRHFENPVWVVDSLNVTINESTCYRRNGYILENSLFDSAGRDIEVLFEEYRNNCIACDLWPYPAFIIEDIIHALPTDCPCHEALALSYPKYTYPQFLFDMEWENETKGIRRVNHHSFVILLIQVGLYNQYHTAVCPATYRYSMAPDAQEMYMWYAVPIKD